MRLGKLTIQDGLYSPSYQILIGRHSRMVIVSMHILEHPLAMVDPLKRHIIVIFGRLLLMANCMSFAVIVKMVVKTIKYHLVRYFMIRH